MNKTTHFTFAIILLLATLGLAACGGGGGGGGDVNTGGDSDGGGDNAPATAANPTLGFAATKAFRFSWSDVADATYYKLLENPDGTSGFTQVGDDIDAGIETVDHIVPLYARVNAQYILQSCNATGCADSATVSVSGALVDSIGYVKASNTGAGDDFGYALSLSDDGDTLAVGAYREGSNATGIGGDQSDNSAANSGAVYVFTRSGGDWAQQAYIKTSNAEAGDRFGFSLSLSGDGDTLAVGAYSEDSNATGIGGDQTDNSATSSGAVYVYARSGATWSQQAYVKASNTEAYDYFSYALSLSGDGDTLAVGAYREDSSATGIGGNQSDNSASSSGAVYVYARSGGVWSQQAYVKTSNTGANDWFGRALSLSGDGDTLAVGAYREDSNATGIGGDASDNSASSAGAVYVYARSGGVWSQQAYVKASNAEADDWFGTALSLSGDGDTLAVGAYYEDSNATGIGGDQSDNSATNSGAVYVFTRSGATWSQQAYVKASNAEAGDYFSYALSLSDDGDTLAVGAYYEDSNATGIGGDQSDNSADRSGMVYVYARSGGWAQQAYIKASNTQADDRFGYALSLSGDGDTLAVGAYRENSNATGIGGDQSDNSASYAGAVYLY